jgi:hypothetical protein
MALGAAALSGSEFYVATSGSDANPGTESKPFASLEAGRDAVRKLDGERKGRGGATIWIRGGVYVREAGFELTTQDGGTAAAPVVYRAWPGESVRLIGGRRLKGFEAVRDPAVLSRLEEKARGHVLHMDLRAQGMSDFGQLQSRGFGRASVPAHAELFFAGRPMTLARWPNEGEWEKIADFPEGAGQGDEHGGKIGALDGGFNYAGDRPRRWTDTGDLWVHGYWAWDWANSYERVQSLDPEKHFIRTAPPHGLYGFRKGQRFYFLNLLEELDQPGEYYIDRKAGRLYFWPPETPAPLETQEVMLSLLDRPLITLSDVSHVTIRGLILECTRGDGVVIRGGESNRVAGCAIRLIGDSGVRVDGGRGHAIVSCDIEDTGDGGVSLSGGDRQTLEPGGQVVENCHFQRQGRWSKCYVPAVAVNGVGQRVSHNLIHDHPHCAILFGGNDHLIDFNEIHHVALETGDVGAIYTGRDWTFRGNRIRHNFIHETGGVGMGSMGVYMDDCVSGAEIFGNVFYKVTRAAFLGGGRDHRVENNIFVDCNPAVQLDGRGLDRSPVWHDMVYDYMRKQSAAVPSALYRSRYPALAALDRFYAADEGVPPEGNVVAHNLCIAGAWLSVGWHARQDMIELADNYVGADPGFINPAALDFRIRDDSTVWKTGFQKIPFPEIGLRDDEDRRALKKLKERAAL